MSAPPGGIPEFVYDPQQAAELGVELTADQGGVAIRLTRAELEFHHGFISGAIASRALQQGQSLLRACNDRKHSIAQVLDLTAGWGADSLTLARHGQQVTLVEHQELVYAIVAHALACLRASDSGREIARRMSIEQGNALACLQRLSEDARPDCIYLDPMFAEHKSSAKPAKEMQILQALTQNLDIEACFELALQRARKRVVVKRPARAAPLFGHKPDLNFREKTIRFDVYLSS